MCVRSGLHWSGTHSVGLDRRDVNTVERGLAGCPQLALNQFCEVVSNYRAHACRVMIQAFRL